MIATPSRICLMYSSMPLRSPSRFSAVSAVFTPPGMANVGWILLPVTDSMMVWPYFLSLTAFSASSGLAFTSPTTLRSAGSESHPRMMSGPASSKKCMACDWMTWPMWMSSLRSFAVLGIFTPRISSHVLAAARWWLTGQIPQIRGVMTGISGKNLPSENFSNPLNWST